MAKKLDVPAELQHLVEKREETDRRAVSWRAVDVAKLQPNSATQLAITQSASTQQIITPAADPSVKTASEAGVQGHASERRQRPERRQLKRGSSGK